MKAYVSIEARAVYKQHITLAHVNDAVRSQYMHYSQSSHSLSATVYMVKAAT